MQLIGAVIRSENESVKFIPPLKPITLKKRRLPRRASFMGLFLIEKFVRYIVCSLFQDIFGHTVKPVFRIPLLYDQLVAAVKQLIERFSDRHLFFGLDKPLRYVAHKPRMGILVSL